MGRELYGWSVGLRMNWGGVRVRGYARARDVMVWMEMPCEWLGSKDSRYPL